MRDRRGRRGARAVTAILTIALTAACTAAPDRAVSRFMAEGFLPVLGRDGGFAAVPDWRTLADPSDVVHAYFESHRAAYRVIWARRDSADLAVWQTDEAGAEPFDADVRGTGHGCVTLTRAGSTPVHTRERPCPAHLGPPADAQQTSWGRDANAVAAAENLLSSMEFDVRWLLTRDANGYRRRVPVTRAQVLAAFRAVRSPGGAVAVQPAIRQRPGRFAAAVRASASAPDPIDTRRTATARRCAVVDVRLDGTDPSGQLTVLRPTPCP